MSPEEPWSENRLMDIGIRIRNVGNSTTTIETITFKYWKNNFTKLLGDKGHLSLGADFKELFGDGRLPYVLEPGHTCEFISKSYEALSEKSSTKKLMFAVYHTKSKKPMLVRVMKH
jgi:hypothetical protein